MIINTKANKVLFIINGLGLGNSTRCYSIISELKLAHPNLEVDVISSGNAIQFFKDKKIINRIFNFKSLFYGKDGNKLSVLNTIISIPQIIKIFLDNCKILKSILNENSYQAIVFDSDYTVASLLFQKRPLLIALNNSHYIIYKIFKLKKLPFSLWGQFFIELLDALFHLIIPDQIICPVLYNTQRKIYKFNLIGPIIRNFSLSKNKSDKIRILVMLSGSQFGTQLQFSEDITQNSNIDIDLIGQTGESYKNIKYHGKLISNYELLENADVIIINSGFSAISEAIVLKKPCLVIPIENHAEQWVNALHIQEYGIGHLTTELKVNDDLKSMINDLDTYKDNCKKLLINNYSKAASDIIWKQLARL